MEYYIQEEVNICTFALKQKVNFKIISVATKVAISWILKVVAPIFFIDFLIRALLREIVVTRFGLEGRKP